MKKVRLTCVVLSAAVLAACGTTHNSAPVVDRPAAGKASEAAKPVVKGSDSHGNYTVKKGDTVYRIALDQGQSYRDIIAWNNLSNPNDIKVDQVLRRHRIVAEDTSGDRVKEDPARARCTRIERRASHPWIRDQPQSQGRSLPRMAEDG